MEALTQLSVALQPYKDVVAAAASTVTIVQLLTPILWVQGQFRSYHLCVTPWFARLLNDIRKNKSTSGSSVVPFLGGAVLSLLFVQFGQMIGDDTTVKVVRIDNRLLDAGLTISCSRTWLVSFWAHFTFASSTITLPWTRNSQCGPKSVQLVHLHARLWCIRW